MLNLIAIPIERPSDNKGDNMSLSKNLIREYQRQHKYKYGEDISPKEAEREILDLKELVRLIAKVRRGRHGK